MRMKSIASGSSGNSIYVGTDATHILVDTGISGKRIDEGLKMLDVDGHDLDAIFVTHEHSDHIQGLGVISRKYNIPIYATRGTIQAILDTSAGSKIDTVLFNEITYDKPVWVKDLEISPIKISHDAAEPTAYRFQSEGKKAAIMTDLGYYDDYIVSKLRDLDAIFLEANHDVRMLQLGRYTYQLKQRILGKRGHLSNETSGRLLSSILNDHMKYIYLSHLSKENNMPELAYEAVRLEVTMSDTDYRGDDFDIRVAKREMPSDTIVF